jgi:hypothetical protein
MDDEYPDGDCQDAPRTCQAQTSPVRRWQIVMRIMENQDEFTRESLGGAWECCNMVVMLLVEFL